MALHGASHTIIFEDKHNFRNAEYVAMKTVAIVMKKTHFRKKTPLLLRDKGFVCPPQKLCAFIAGKEGMEREREREP